jgi:DNA invertase Pin-like site-specific DNA recombinase
MRKNGRRFLTDIPERASRAAQYVRMSTDHQKYSTQNQGEAIAAYAERRGLTIVRSYEDEGRSGLDIDGRQALQDLIGDVKSGRADFECILVYDVSRWGRFQDADESAYYASSSAKKPACGFITVRNCLKMTAA